MLTVFVTITRSYICSSNSYCDNNGDVYIQTIMEMSICSANSYCGNNEEVYMQC